MNEFKTKHINELATSRRAVDQAIEAAQVNIAWIQNNLQVQSRHYKLIHMYKVKEA